VGIVLVVTTGISAILNLLRQPGAPRMASALGG
jgi:hypothetical protein